MHPKADAAQEALAEAARLLLAYGELEAVMAVVAVMGRRAATSENRPAGLVELASRRGMVVA